MSNQPLTSVRIILAGQVDHGKSTLIGRLFHDLGQFPEGRVEELKASAARRGMGFEWSFALDALQAERDQNVTIDTTRRWLRLPGREYVLIDAPGHVEFLKNMATGASEAEAALLMVDAGEGVTAQTRRHALILSLLGITQIAVLVNKMDAAGFSEARFQAVSAQAEQMLAALHLHPSCILPVSAREGENLVASSARMPWYQGPHLMQALAAFAPRPSRAAQPLRFPVQDVYKRDDKRVIVGCLESGTLRVGDSLLFSPANRTAKVASVEVWPEQTKNEAASGESVGITLDTPLFIERGQIASHTQDAPKLLAQFRLRLFWFAETPLVAGTRLELALATGRYTVEALAVECVIDAEHADAKAAPEVYRHQVADVVFRVRGLLPADDGTAFIATGRAVLRDGYTVVGAGLVNTDGFADQRARTSAVKSGNITSVDLHVTRGEREERNGHRGGVMWLTGLSGSGKSTLALELEKRLFDRGFQVWVLDGDNLRGGLCADLGFSPVDRAENIRRAGEVAALFARAGVIVITAFISPYREDRHRARAAAPEDFHLVHVKADLATCEARDPKGLYARARRGEIAEFTGVSAPYEEPENPDLLVDTIHTDIEACADQLEAYALHVFVNANTSR